MEHLASYPVSGRTAFFAMTGRSDGDFSWGSGAASVAQSRQRISAVANDGWTQPRQVHSDRVIVASKPGVGDRSVGDAVVTAATNAAIAVQVADCVPIGLVHADGAIGVVHAGWRGAFLGVIEAAVRSLSETVPSPSTRSTMRAIIGPHICVSCYAFGAEQLQALAKRFGADIVGETATGSPALDMTTVVRNELERLDVEIDVIAPGCTGHNEDRYWSHRARTEPQRQALLAVQTDRVDRWQAMVAP